MDAQRNFGSRGRGRGRGGAPRGGRGGGRGGGFVYVKKSQQRSEHVHQLKLNFWKKVLPEFRAEQQGADGGPLDADSKESPAAGKKRRRDIDATIPNRDEGPSAETAALAAPVAKAVQQMPPDHSDPRSDYDDAAHISAANRALRAPAALRGGTRGGRGAAAPRRGDAHMFSRPNRFSGALARAAAVADEAARAADAAAAKRARLEARGADRREAAARYAQRTGRGQPVMRHRLQDLLGRIERQQQGGGPQGLLSGAAAEPAQTKAQ